MQLLKTKFHIPEFDASRMVSRKRLCSLMGYDTQLISISAPAGFGKTTLLAEWAANCPLKVAWVSLEPSENSLHVFWHYVISAISGAADGCGNNALNQIQTSGTIPIETILIGLINDIADQAKGFALVLDDYHIISDGSIHDSMAFFIDHLPSCSRLIISGREHPPFLPSRFRLSGRLREVTALDLRFRDDETNTLLNRIYHLGPWIRHGSRGLSSKRFFRIGSLLCRKVL